jgi:hypothetical protein
MEPGHRSYVLLLPIALAGAVLCGGCSTPGKVTMQVNIVQLDKYVRAARSPECDMPILNGMPLTNYKQVAIVEVWADQKDEKADVIPVLKRKACETGADALVILDSEHQDIKHFLYQASPNETLNEVTQQDVYSGQGQFIQEAEHTRRVGEAGHNGFYMNAVAINYLVNTDQSSQRNTATPPPHG